MNAINLSTKEEAYYKSIYAAQQKIGISISISISIIKMVCEGLNNCKTSISKKDDQRYTF